jgi:hypothetical protein
MHEAIVIAIIGAICVAVGMLMGRNASSAEAKINAEIQILRNRVDTLGSKLFGTSDADFKAAEAKVESWIAELRAKL